MIKKIKNYFFKRRLKKRGGKGVKIEGYIECRNPEGLKMGEYVYIGPDAKFWGTGNLIIGNNVVIGPCLTTITTNHNYRGVMLPYDKQAICKDIVIEDNVWIASHVCIVPGVRIGEGAIVSMGTVVTKDVPPLAIVGSNKLDVIGYRDEAAYQEMVKRGDLYLEKKYKGLL